MEPAISLSLALQIFSLLLALGIQGAVVIRLVRSDFRLKLRELRTDLSARIDKVEMAISTFSNSHSNLAGRVNGLSETVRDHAGRISSLEHRR